ncbi:Ig-like domain-containing protein [Sulfurovum sp. NBC37-1]|uniref:Ig-like domain-containing protein n=1 Tax=Sulfurovum sp. (strain NBC37-1) TaxID=387093 RepID=UPI002100C2E7|nr:Ig-like domain-containing protein [Sulfurovum sp. NBC37-1]
MTGCGGGGGGGDDHTPIPPTLKSIEITPSQAMLKVGETQAFTVKGTYSDGNVKDITGNVSFSSSDENIVKLDGNTARAVGAGQATITAIAGPGITDTTTVTVTVPNATVTDVQLTFKNGQTAVEVPVDAYGELKVKVVYSDGSTWELTSSEIENSIVFSVSDSKVVDVHKDGFVSAIASGEATITANFEETASNMVSVTVKPETVTLESITLSPLDHTMPVGDQIQFTATGHYSDNSVEDITLSVNWNSSDPKVASIDAKGLVTANAEGTANITATLDSISESRGVTVKAANITSIQLTFANGQTSATVPVGTTGTLEAIATYSDGENADVTNRVSYFAYDDKVVDVQKNGSVRAVAAGSSEIKAKLDGVESNAVSVKAVPVTLQGIEIQGEDDTLFTGEQTQLTAMGSFSDGIVRDITQDVSWRSENLDVATVDDKGIVTANNKGREGDAVIKAAYELVESSLTIHVKNPTQVTSLKIVEDDGSISTNGEFVVGETLKFKALADFDNGVTGRDVTQYVTWTASPVGTVSVDQNGLVTALKAGDAFVTAAYKGTHGNVSDTIRGTVVEKTVTEVVVFSDPEPAKTEVGHSIRLEAWATFNDGSNQNVSDTVKWTTDNSDTFVRVDKDNPKLVTLEVIAAANGTVTAEHSSGVRGSKSFIFEGKTPDHIEIQESYCGDGNCPVITGKTVDIPIVDDVNYDPVSEGAYYPTAWLVYSDGSKEYINTERGINWWSADQVRAYVNTLKGSFVFGRGVGNGIEIKVTYSRDRDYTASFYVNVKEDTTTKTLEEIGIVNTKDQGWGCTPNDADYGKKLTVAVEEHGKWLQACGKFNYSDGTVKWEDINNNVAWFSSDRDVARVSTYTGDLKAISVGNAVITAQLTEIKGSIDVVVTNDANATE